jgi:hypothetical protein
MTPYGSYQLYQVERPKSAAEIRRADVQAGLLAATVTDLLHVFARPVRAIRKPRLAAAATSASCTAA